MRTNFDIVGNVNYEVAHHPNYISSNKEYADDLTNHFGLKTKLKYRLIQNMKTIGPSNRATEITKMLVKK